MTDPLQLLSPEEYAEYKRNELRDRARDEAIIDDDEEELGNNGEPIKHYSEDDPAIQR